MAKFYVLIEKNKVRKDGSYPIAIKVQWQRGKGHIPTGMHATKKQVVHTNSGAVKLKDTFLQKLLGDRIAIYERIMLEMGLSANSYSAQDLAKYIITKANENAAPKDERPVAALSLTDFTNDYIKKRQELDIRKNLNTGGMPCTIKTALHSLQRFAKKENLLFDDITSAFLDNYCHWMQTKKNGNGANLKGRGLQKYLATLNHLFKMAERRFNNKRERKVLIFNPLDDYPVPKPLVPKKRAVTLLQMRQIRDFPAENGSPAEFAKDMFLLSFYLMGMNAVDLYHCAAPVDGWITYNRAKTRHRRDDNAEICVKIPAEAIPILEKYKDCKRLLNIFKKYTSANTLTTALNKGLKDIGCVISPQLPDLTFYAARHTWATIAENNAGLSTSLVDRCLNHTDSKLKMARTYIKTDWRPINKANRAVLDFFANGTDEDSMDF